MGQGVNPLALVAGAAIAPAQVRAAAQAQQKRKVIRKEEREFPSRRRSSPALETAGKTTPMERASENGSRGETPCAGAGAAIAPAQVWAAAQRSTKAKPKGKGRSASFRADALHPQWKRHFRATPWERAGRNAPVPPATHKPARTGQNANAGGFFVCNYLRMVMTSRARLGVLRLRPSTSVM